MSWTLSQAFQDHSGNLLYLQEAEAESLGANSSDGKRSAQLSLTSMPATCSSRGKMTDASIHSQSGTMSQPSTGDRGVDVWTLSLVDFHARTSAAPAKEQVSKANEAVSGTRWQESFAKWDHDSSSWKTPQCSLFGDLESFSETWPRWGIMRHGACYLPLMPELPTFERESGLLPTPTHKALISWWASAEYKTKQPFNIKKMTGGQRKSGAKIGSNLSWTLAEWHLRNGGQRESTLVPDPCFYEVMMGWPMQWTASDDAATDRFHRWLQWHGKSSPATTNRSVQLEVA